MTRAQPLWRLWVTVNLMTLSTVLAWHRRMLRLSGAEPMKDIPLIDKVPTWRFYRQGRCVQQVRGRGDVDECRLELAKVIRDLGVPEVPRRISVGDIAELQDLRELEEVLSRLGPDSVALVKYYGRACKQCVRVAPMFDSLPFAYQNRDISFYRADVTLFPELVVPPPDPPTVEGLDRSQDIDVRLEGCPRCGGSGFVECWGCLGKGYILKEAAGFAVADICTTCTGHKKVPCPQCGGKCYLC